MRDCPASEFIQDVERVAKQRQDHLNSMTPLEISKEIYRVANMAAIKDDIRIVISELSSALMVQLGEENDKGN